MTGTGLAVILFLALSPLASDLQYAHSYNADEAPEMSAPKWTGKGSGATAEVAEGVLHIQGEGANTRKFYLLDQASGAWDMASGMATVEFRLKCNAADPQDEVFRVQITDGKSLWRVVFYPNRCNGVKVATDEWDTYRLAIKDGQMQISSEKQGVIALQNEAVPHDEPPALIFGTFKNPKSQTSREWSLDFIRWTNEEARMHEAGDSSQ
jgi:hypothetical protein